MGHPESILVSFIVGIILLLTLLLVLLKTYMKMVSLLALVLDGIPGTMANLKIKIMTGSMNKKKNSTR